MMLDCDEVYEKLRSTLVFYAAKLDSVKIQIFAIEMEIRPETERSWDPALIALFREACPGKVTLSEAYALAATYVESEIVGLRHEKAAEQIVTDLRAASRDPGAAPPALLDWGTRKDNEQE